MYPSMKASLSSSADMIPVVRNRNYQSSDTSIHASHEPECSLCHLACDQIGDGWQQQLCHIACNSTVCR
jgi:hypothetical protein